MISIDEKENSTAADLVLVPAFSAQFEEVRSELVRKSIHFLIALTPAIAAFDRSFAVILLAGGTLFYAFAERNRIAGVTMPLISSLTAMAARDRDLGRFVLGPVTLGLGALLSLLLYPDPAASVAIYALAFGDGLASLVGKVFGRFRPAFLMGKSVEGSLACFVAVLLASWKVTADFRLSLFAALVATLVEALPLEDYDNIALPLAVGLTVRVLGG